MFDVLLLDLLKNYRKLTRRNDSPVYSAESHRPLMFRPFFFRKNQISFLPKCINVLAGLLKDQSPQVIKRVIQACAAVYKNFLQWLCTMNDVPEETEKAWNTLCIMKADILDKIDDDNDGIRTNAIKFLEGVVILQTYADEDSMKRPNDISLESVPLNLKIVRRRKLEDEAVHIFESLLKFHAAAHISSVNLIACTGTLCTIAKMRPSFMTPVVMALKNLHANLPPTLTDSQVNSVRKHLKMQLLNIIRQPAAFEMQSTISEILVDLGASNSEIAKAIPKMDKKEQARRSKRALENATAAAAKRIKIEKVDKPTMRREMEIDVDEIEDQKRRSNKLNEAFLLDHLKNKETVAELIIESMQNLPDEIPAHFRRNYAPDVDLTIPQRTQKIATQLAELMTAERLGPGAAEITKDPPMRIKVSAEEEKNIVLGLRKDGAATVTESTSAEINLDEDMDEAGGDENDETRREEATKKLRENMERAKGGDSSIIPRMKQRAKELKLQEITKPIARAKKETFLVQAVNRILNAEKRSIAGGVSNKRIKILTVLGATFTPSVRESIIKFILIDLRNRFELAFSWLFEEYSLLQGFTRHTYIKSEHKPDHAYNKLLNEIIAGILENNDEHFDKEAYIRKTYMMAPTLPDDAYASLISICEMADLSSCGMEILRELTLRRPPTQLKHLNVLLKYSVHDVSDLREVAAANLLKIYVARPNLVETIEEFALRWLHFLEKATPPADVLHTDYGRSEAAVIWTESLTKICLTPFLTILPQHDDLIEELSQVYVNTTPEIKQTIRRSIDTAIRTMGAENIRILKLIEDGTKGAETLITRIIQILTERTTPNAELVRRVRDLYHTKVSDVRLLIPIINGLTKQEIIAALPKLLRLNPIVLKEVFKKLLGIGADVDASANKMLPLSSADLLVALHTLDPTKIELKFVVQATTICLTEKDIRLCYTQDILAIVLQQLADITPLPTLLMRTILQSLTLYPRLGAFACNILQRLIPKQVWKQKVVWEGFLKCCQKLSPGSLPVLLLLPPVQLQDALNTCPELRQPLIEHANETMEKQNVIVPKITMDILLGNTEELFITVNIRRLTFSVWKNSISHFKFLLFIFFLSALRKKNRKFLAAKTTR